MNRGRKLTMMQRPADQEEIVSGGLVETGGESFPPRVGRNSESKRCAGGGLLDDFLGTSPGKGMATLT